jgi:hypothetical protein
MDIQQETNLRLKEVFEESGIEFAYLPRGSSSIPRYRRPRAVAQRVIGRGHDLDAHLRERVLDRAVEVGVDRSHPIGIVGRNVELVSDKVIVQGGLENEGRGIFQEALNAWHGG